MGTIRQDLFISEGAHASFENCLFEACEKCEWLVEDDAAQKEMAFEKMCRGWAIGTKDFKKALLKELEEAREENEKGDGSDAVPRYYGEGLREANRLRWEMLLEKGLSRLGKGAASIKTDLKSAKWKIMLAALLKQKTSATNVWITGKLNMGTPDAVSRYVSEFRQRGGHKETEYEQLTTKVMK